MNPLNEYARPQYELAQMAADRDERTAWRADGTLGAYTCAKCQRFMFDGDALLLTASGFRHINCQKEAA